MTQLVCYHCCCCCCCVNALQPVCENHDDGVTPALVQCEDCGNLCGECDRILHLRKKMKSHQRKVKGRNEAAGCACVCACTVAVQLDWDVGLVLC